MPSRAKQYAAMLGYPCIFSKSPEDAAESLFWHISERRAGFNEGCAEWLSIIAEMLQDNFDKQLLNSPGTSFSDEWWGRTLRLLQDKLTHFARTEGG